MKNLKDFLRMTVNGGGKAICAGLWILTAAELFSLGRNVAVGKEIYDNHKKLSTLRLNTYELTKQSNGMKYEDAIAQMNQLKAANDSLRNVMYENRSPSIKLMERVTQKEY